MHGSGKGWISVMDRLFQKGYIFDPREKAKSVVLTEEGLMKEEGLFTELFGKKKETVL